MPVRHLLVLFGLSLVAVSAQNRNFPYTPSAHYAVAQSSAEPPAQPAAQATPQTSQPAAQSDTQQPAEQEPAPVVRVTRQPPTTTQAEPADSAEKSQPEPSESADKKTDKKAEKKADKKEDKQDDNDRPVNTAELHNTSIWHDPGNIASLDLFLGQGGRKGMPAAPFVFESEDMNGTNPKFDVRDANGKKWRVKLGEEARPEVVASRLLWATGYYVNDDYVLTTADIQNLHLHRGASRVKDGRIAEARFARKPKGQKKIGIWKWKENPFTGSREFNGLRVMMAVMNSWDLKDINNAVFEDSRTGQDLFLMSDVGATFGTNGLSWTRARSKGNIESFKDSKFIEKTTDTTVTFGTPKPPTARLIATAGIGEAKDYVDRVGMEWIGEDIPRQDARWIGSLLKQLSHDQLVDAFRAGHFPPDQIEAYVDLVESRIQELSAL